MIDDHNAHYADHYDHYDDNEEAKKYVVIFLPKFNIVIDQLKSWYKLTCTSFRMHQKIYFFTTTKEYDFQAFAPNICSSISI